VRAVTLHNRRACDECAARLRGVRVLLSNRSLVAAASPAAGPSGGDMRAVLEELARGGGAAAGVVDCGETGALPPAALAGPLTLHCAAVASHVTVRPRLPPSCAQCPRAAGLTPPARAQVVLPGDRRILSLCEVEVWGAPLAAPAAAAAPRVADAVVALADAYSFTKVPP
jgi:hypothetical protein